MEIIFTLNICYFEVTFYTNGIDEFGETLEKFVSKYWFFPR